MPKKTYNVGMAKHLLDKSTYTDILLSIAKRHTQTSIPPHVVVKLPHLVNADFFPDIFSTILGLRRVNEFNCYCFFRMSVHQQPDPGTEEKLKVENKYNLHTANLNAHASFCFAAGAGVLIYSFKQS